MPTCTNIVDTKLNPMWHTIINVTWASVSPQQLQVCADGNCVDIPDSAQRGWGDSLSPGRGAWARPPGKHWLLILQSGSQGMFQRAYACCVYQYHLVFSANHSRQTSFLSTIDHRSNVHHLCIEVVHCAIAPLATSMLAWHYSSRSVCNPERIFALHGYDSACDCIGMASLH